MQESLDLTRLDTITNGNPQLKEELLKLFFATVEKCTNNMQDTSAGSNDIWHRSLHELKGASENLGFETVADICRSIEDQDLPEQNKQAIVTDILAATQQIRAFTAHIS